jgi:hypothetical protein
MEIEKIKTATKTMRELAECGTDFGCAMRGTTRQVAATKKLWKAGNKSRLIKIGVACIVFPDPSPVSEIIGAGFIAAGLIQKGIQNQSIYLEDIKKGLESTLREVNATKQSLRL